MDVIVIAEQGGAVWRLTDLLGRSMGNIREDTPIVSRSTRRAMRSRRWPAYNAGRMTLSTLLWLRSRRTRGAFVVALQAKSILRQGLISGLVSK